MKPRRAGNRPAPRQTRWRGMLGVGVLLGAAVLVGWWLRPARPEASTAEAAAPAATAPSPVTDTAQKHIAAARAALATRPRDALVELARLYHANGLDADARAAWEKLRAQEPEEPRWAYCLAALHRRAARDELVAALLQETVRLAPDYAPAWLELADFALKHNDTKAAAAAYERRLELMPRDPYARLGLARIALQQQRTADGSAIVRELVRDQPGFASAHNLHAELLEASGDATGAARERQLGSQAGRFRSAEDPWLEELRAWCFDPAQLTIWGLVELHTQHGDWGRALFERALQVSPSDPQAHLNLARVFQESGNFAAASNRLEQAATLPAADESVFARLSDSYLGNRQATRALDAAERGLARFPGAPRLALARGNALRALNRPADAIAAYREALLARPNLVEALAGIGSTQLQLGQVEDARITFQRALEIQPRYVPALVPYSHLEIDAGRPAAAAPLVDAFVAQHPDDATARQLWVKQRLAIASDRQRAGDLAGAEQVCRESLAILPESVPLHDFLAWILTQQGRSDDALAALGVSQRLLPGSPKVHLLAGVLRSRLGQTDRARQEWQQGLDLARAQGETALAAELEKLLANSAH